MNKTSTSITMQKYVVAVSGGVDSVVLLHKILSNQLSELPITDAREQIIVAHVNHGMRPDSKDDANFVANLAKLNNLRFESFDAKLGENASEELARSVRYKFLFDIAKQYSALVMTAHHQDDYIETAVMAMLRGTGPFGVTVIARNKQVLRPMIDTAKQQIIDYATTHQLKWREDTSNYDEKYFRNYVRKNITPRLQKKRSEFVELLTKLQVNTDAIELELQAIFPKIIDGGLVKRSNILEMSFSEICEVSRSLLREVGLPADSRLAIEHLALALKVLPISKKMSLNKDYFLVSKRKGCEIIDNNGGSLLYNLNLYGQEKTES